jgi:hypothetical protein
VVFLEIDEHGHCDRLPSCEIAKIIDQTIAVRQKYADATVMHFRFNPSEFDHQKVDLDSRIDKTVADMQLFLRADISWSPHVPSVSYYFYPQKSHFQIQHALDDAGDAVQVLIVKNDAFQHVSTLKEVTNSWCS